MDVQSFTGQGISRSAAATQALGRRLGGLLQPGDVVALTGDLGAGKTELVRGVCTGAEVPPSEVSSPTFAIVATYRGRIPVHHADLYRIGDEDELYGTGFGDLVGGEGALLVEWADRIPGALPAARLSIRLAHDERLPNVRRLEVEGVGERHAALARDLLAPEKAKRKPARRAPAARRPVKKKPVVKAKAASRKVKAPPRSRRAPTPRGKAVRTKPVRRPRAAPRVARASSPKAKAAPKRAAARRR